MARMVKFIDKDKELLMKISEYQKAHGLSSFIDAVRKLCSDALEIEKNKTLKEKKNEKGALFDCGGYHFNGFCFCIRGLLI